MGANFLQRQKVLQDELFKIAERITRQYDLDTLQIALARYPKLDLGYIRIMEICRLWDEVKEEYDLVLKRHPEQDYAQAKMDRELRQIMAHRAADLIPCKDRYPELRKPM